jgi:hypothetical protein
LDLPDQRQEVRVVVHRIIGQLGLPVQRNLKFFANFDSVLIQETCQLRSVDPLRGIALHKDQPIATVRPSNFHQQGHIKYNRWDVWTLIILGNELLGSLQYAWVNHFVQNAQLLGVGKNDLAQPGAVDPSGRVQDLPTQLPHEFVAN